MPTLTGNFNSRPGPGSYICWCSFPSSCLQLGVLAWSRVIFVYSFGETREIRLSGETEEW